MPSYMVQVAYKSEGWAAQMKNPQNRIEAVRPAIEALGGKIVAAYYSFGEYDLAVITEMPDNTSAAAFSIAASAGGSVKALKTTPLMTVDEGLDAVRKASQTSYRPPK